MVQPNRRLLLKPVWDFSFLSICIVNVNYKLIVRCVTAVFSNVVALKVNCITKCLWHPLNKWIKISKIKKKVKKKMKHSSKLK